MIFVLEETAHDKTPGLNNPESYVLTLNRFDTCLILIFSDLNKAQIYKRAYRGSPCQEIEIQMSFDCLSLFKANKHTEDYYNRGPNDKIFLIGIGDKK